MVKEVSMEINPGDYLCIVGENGSGKSTLMKGLLGLIKPTGGVLTLADELRGPESDISRNRPRPRRISLRRYRRS